MEIPSEVQVALAAFVAVLAANALKWGSRFITNYVRGTPNQIDDKIWAAVREALEQDRDEQEGRAPGKEESKATSLHIFDEASAVPDKIFEVRESDAPNWNRPDKEAD